MESTMTWTASCCVITGIRLLAEEIIGFFIVAIAFRPTLGPTHTPILLVPELFPGDKSAEV